VVADWLGVSARGASHECILGSFPEKSLAILQGHPCIVSWARNDRRGFLAQLGCCAVPARRRTASLRLAWGCLWDIWPVHEVFQNPPRTAVEETVRTIVACFESASGLFRPVLSFLRQSLGPRIRGCERSLTRRFNIDRSRSKSDFRRRPRLSTQRTGARKEIQRCRKPRQRCLLFSVTLSLRAFCAVARALRSATATLRTPDRLAVFRCRVHRAG
jgi:hypothetical protein